MLIIGYYGPNDAGHPARMHAFYKKITKAKRDRGGERCSIYIETKNMKRVAEPPADVRLIPPFNLFWNSHGGGCCCDKLLSGGPGRFLLNY
jgi:hypothetical protein